MRPCWAYWASKKCTKNKPGVALEFVGVNLEPFERVYLTNANDVLCDFTRWR